MTSAALRQFWAVGPAALRQFWAVGAWAELYDQCARRAVAAGLRAAYRAPGSAA